MPQFLHPEQIAEVHRSVVKRYGGDPRVRDYGMLESAALAPQETRFGELINRTLRAQAAIYWLSVALNRPFYDQNALTGLVACEVFLEMNGFFIDLEDRQIAELLNRVETRQIIAKDKLLQGFKVRAF